MIRHRESFISQDLVLDATAERMICGLLACCNQDDATPASRTRSMTVRPKKSFGRLSSDVVSLWCCRSVKVRPFGWTCRGRLRKAFRLFVYRSYLDLALVVGRCVIEVCLCGK